MARIAVGERREKDGLKKREKKKVRNGNYTKENERMGDKKRMGKEGTKGRLREE